MSEELSRDVVMNRRFELDEQIAIISGRHKAELEPLVEEMKLCEMFIKDSMNTAGEQQVKIANGHMCFFTTKDSATVENFDVTVAYIKANDAWHLLNKAVNKTAAKEMIETGVAPETLGIKYASYRDLSWRRGKG